MSMTPTTEEAKTKGHELAERVCHEEQTVIWSSEMAERLAMGDWLREHMSYEDKLGFYADLSEGLRDIIGAAFDLAAPRTGSAEMTAGEDDDWAGTLARSVLHRKGYDHAHLVNAVAEELRRIDAVGYTKGHEAATPAPSSPGVPDSLRALSEAATQGEFNTGVTDQRWGYTICAGPMWRVIAQFERHEDAEFFAAAGMHVRHRIATHPAGQSDGQGAEPRQMAEGCCSAVSPCSHQQRDPYSLCAVCQKANGLADKIKAAAPVSTRTGDEGTEPPWPEQYAALADGYGPVEEWRDWTKRAERDPFSDGALHALRGMIGEFVSDALAARPADPEAQGAWQEIGNLELKQRAVLGRWFRGPDNEDGSAFWYWQYGTGCFFEYLGKRHWSLDSGSFEGSPFYGSQPTHFLAIATPPAHPALPSSGQEG